MARATIVSLLLVFVLAAYGGVVQNENFIVFADEDQQEILNTAEKFQKQFMKDWGLNQSLRTVINLNTTDGEARGLTWAKDRPDRTLHNIFLWGNSRNILRGVLQHEIVHTVLASNFDPRLPSWVEEGIATMYEGNIGGDDASRAAYLKRWVRQDRFPNIYDFINLVQIKSYETEKYAAAESMVRYLSEKGRGKFLSFASDLETLSLGTALHKHYGMSAIELQYEWENWVRNNTITKESK